MVDKGKLNKRRWGGCYPNLAVGFSLYCQEWEQSGHHGPYLGPEFKKQLSGVRADKCPKCPHDLQMAMRGSAGSGWCHSKPFHCCHPLINNFDVTVKKVTKIVSGRLWNLQWGCLKCLLGPSDRVVVNSGQSNVDKVNTQRHHRHIWYLYPQILLWIHCTWKPSKVTTSPNTKNDKKHWNHHHKRRQTKRSDHGVRCEGKPRDSFFLSIFPQWRFLTLAHYTSSITCSAMPSSCCMTR